MSDTATTTTQAAAPPAPTLFTYTYRRPGAVHDVTLDCFRQDGDAAAALRSARRWIAREQRALRRAGSAAKLRTPQLHHMRPTALAGAA